MRIALAASEAVPYCKTGGLADVMGALPQELAKKKHAVTLFLPLYQIIDRDRFDLIDTGYEVTVPMRDTRHRVSLWMPREDKNPNVIFFESEDYFDRPGLYGAKPNTGYMDNDERFVLYGRAVLEACKVLKFKPDIVHANDWQAGLICAYLKTIYSTVPFFSRTASVFTIHNIAYQGLFPKESFPTTGLPSQEFHMEGVEFYGQVNFLKAGLMYADAINTVSPTYAKEIQFDPKKGCGMEGILQKRRNRFRGILNGLDQNAWNPRTDKHLVAPLRALCKADLQKIAGFEIKKDIPLIAFIGRLDHHKGIDVLLEIAPRLLRHSVQLVFLGSGDERYQEALRNLQKHRPGQVYVETKFAEDLAHKIYGGADIFLMPSHFEPCGLAQMIAMRYGAFPVVSPTGGLVDTVKPIRRPHLEGTGFVGRSDNARDFEAAVFEALSLFGEQKKWQKLQKKIMQVDHSWTQPINDYIEMYKQALQWHADE